MIYFAHSCLAFNWAFHSSLSECLRYMPMDWPFFTISLTIRNSNSFFFFFCSGFWVGCPFDLLIWNRFGTVALIEVEIVLRRHRAPFFLSDGGWTVAKGSACCRIFWSPYSWGASLIFLCMPVQLKLFLWVLLIVRAVVWVEGTFISQENLLFLWKLWRVS